MTDVNECGCGAPCPDAYACGRCASELRELLSSLLPVRDMQGRWRNGLLDYIEDSAVGATRLGDVGRRMKHSSDLHGDEHADALAFNWGRLEALGYSSSDRLEGGGRFGIEEPKFTLNRVLAAGKVNCKASDLGEEIRSTLGQWATFVHGGALPVPPSWSRPVSEYQHTSTECARFLKDHIAELSNLEDVGELLYELRKYVRRAENIINRPPQPLPLGLCPTIIDRGRLGKSECNTRLEAHRTATTVLCPQCSCAYEVKWLREEALRKASHEPRTRSQILRVIAGFKDVVGGPLPAGTFDSWVFRGSVTPVGYVNRAGVLAEFKQDPSDRPVYRINDVIDQMAASSRKNSEGVVA